MAVLGLSSPRLRSTTKIEKIQLLAGDFLINVSEVAFNVNANVNAMFIISIHRKNG
jgi:hypothetical protein